jgi:hypothetical protein
MANCKKYLDCGDAYSLVAYAVCQAAGDSAWDSCVRTCLQDKFTCGQSYWKDLTDHVDCFAACTAAQLINGARQIVRRTASSLWQNLKKWVFGDFE